jgi:hypothetical protein
LVVLIKLGMPMQVVFFGEFTTKHPAAKGHIMFGMTS